MAARGLKPGDQRYRELQVCLHQMFEMAEQLALDEPEVAVVAHTIGVAEAHINSIVSRRGSAAELDRP
jgi:hypothetical protein